MNNPLPQYFEEAVPFWLVNYQNLNVNNIKLFEEIKNIYNKNLVSYSPIFPAFLGQRKNSHKNFSHYSCIKSITYLFTLNTHKILGFLKTNPTIVDLTEVYISNGLASIVITNCSECILNKISELVIYDEISSIEYWELKDCGEIIKKIYNENCYKIESTEIDFSKLLVVVPEKIIGTTIDTYAEQISFSLTYLAKVYQKIIPSEVATLYKQKELIDAILVNIMKYFDEINKCIAKDDIPGCLAIQKTVNSYEAHLVEICASLSYAITQGTSGISPILENPSPFPHQRLLGIGGANKALISFVRNIEISMNTVNAVEIIEKGYSQNKTELINPNFLHYTSGEIYKSSYSNTDSSHQLDQYKTGNEITIPLITHFSLRHGFKESPVSVTAASESLSHEIDPHWTLMTLSHEIMHSRVRSIVDSLMKNTENNFINHFHSFNNWLNSCNSNKSVFIKDGLRNIIYLFCMNCEELLRGKEIEFKQNKATDNGKKLRNFFISHQMKAVELMVHFHDFFFIFENDFETYFKSIFISWSKVSAPCNNHEYYLTRCLATAALGSGMEYYDAFHMAREKLLEVLFELKEQNQDSPFINQCIYTLENAKNSDQNNKKQLSSLLCEFKISYFLIDQFSLYFSSTALLKNLHYTKSVTSNEENIHNVEIYGEGKFINPIAYSIASLKKSIIKDHQILDSRWLSAWNSMVISSYPERASHAA